MKHEWKLVATDLRPSGFLQRGPAPFFKDVAALEAEGWEVVNVTGYSNTSTSFIIARRPAEETEVQP